MATKEELIRQYAKALQEGYAAVFAGAGLSRSSGFIDWKNLLRPLAKDISLDVDKEHDLVSLAQFYRNERGNRAGVNQAIIDAFTSEAHDNENIDILTRLPVYTYWTTNYDKLLETSLQKYNRRADVKVATSQLATTLVDRDAVVYKMHGDVSDPAHAVLTKDDYETYGNTRPLFRTALQGDLISKTFLFIGFSFEDPNLDYILSQIHSLMGENERDHYCFFRNIVRETGETDEDFAYRKVRQELRIKDLQRYGIQAVVVDEYSEITEILKDIETRYLLNNVFISGSAEEYFTWDKSSAEQLAYLLGKQLVSKDYRVTTGFGLGIGSSVINGALDEIYSTRFRHIDEYLCLRPFPQGITDADKRKKLYTKYREEMISDAGVAVFMFGNKKDATGTIIEANGCEEEFEIAKKLKKIIIPLGSTGYVAQKIWKEIKADMGNYSYLNKYIDILGSNTDVDELVSTVLKIISEIKG